MGQPGLERLLEVHQMVAVFAGQLDLEPQVGLWYRG